MITNGYGVPFGGNDFGVGYTTLIILYITDFYTLSGWILWDVHLTSIKVFFKRIRKCYNFMPINVII